MRHLPRFVALLAVAAATVTSTSGLANAATTASVVTPVWGTYQTVAPARVLDTRYGTGAPKAPVGAGRAIDVPILGKGGVPATGVSAVVLNMTVTGATKGSYLTVWPAGTTRPTASSINFVAGASRANLVTVPLGTLGTGVGKISIFNQQGGVQVIADVMGYYLADGAATAGGLYQRVTPERSLDSRDPGFGGPFAPGEAITVPVSYVDNSDPANIIDLDPHIVALAVNLTAVSPAKPGYLVSWAGSAPAPSTSTLNFAAGTVTPNMAIVPVGPCTSCTGSWNGKPSITILNQSAGSTHVLMDVVGFYDDGQIGDGLRFRPMAPTRIVDTRKGQGATTFPGKATRTVTAPVPVAGADTYSLVTNTTAVLPTLSTFLTLWDDAAVKPWVSNLNVAKGRTVANATITGVGAGNIFKIYNDQGAVNVLVDVMGTMEYVPNTAPVAAPLAAAARAAAPRAVATPRIFTANGAAEPVQRASR